MNAFQFGQHVYSTQGAARAFRASLDVANRISPVSGILVASGAAAPFVGTALTVASTLYGAKQIYDGLKGYF
jgi:hypothetical protein